MSREGLEIEELARRFVELYNRRDLEGLEAVTDPTLQVVPGIAGMEAGGVMRGHADFPRRYFRLMEEAFSAFKIVAHEYSVAAPRVQITCDFHGVGVESGADTFTRLYLVWEVRDGKLLRERSFRDREEAARALEDGAGLP